MNRIGLPVTLYKNDNAEFLLTPNLEFCTPTFCFFTSERWLFYSSFLNHSENSNNDNIHKHLPVSSSTTSDEILCWDDKILCKTYVLMLCVTDEIKLKYV